MGKACREDLMEFSKVVFYGRLGEQALKMFGLEEELER